MRLKRVRELTSKLLGNICDKDAGLLRGHEEDCKHDEDMQSFDTNLKARTTELISSLASSGAISTEYLKDVVNYVTVWNQTTVDSILQLEKDIRAEGKKGVKGKQSKKSKRKNSRFQTVVDKYEDSSQEMLDLLSELDKFVKSACNSHSSIETVVQEYFDKQENPNDSGTSSTTHDHCKRISEKLKNIKAAAHNSLAETLLQKFEALITMHQQLLENLTVQKEKLGKKQQTAHAWRKATNMLFISSVAAMLLWSVAAAAVLASPTTVALAAAIAASTGALMEGQHWIVSWLKEWENDLKKEENQVDEMHENTRLAFTELNNINKAVNEIDVLLGQPDSAIAEEQINVTMKDIQKKLEPFMTKIEGLKGDVDKCRIELMNTRDAVVSAGSALMSILEPV
ncbi:UPF0496 protein [Prunus yedoensis var. nudiflora]|uniref:UPF0496 protein n=1 Tax=Prunus yedoensis var. nudiflora TaxID=2094558 RepID=A0A314ZRS8_PRUYE|nr:UPF0496 protein [Prunus yedoensis var. nudiflora]